jgi:sugar lactone lactonase YvrE/enterochelin esterase-like enzyme
MKIAFLLALCALAPTQNYAQEYKYGADSERHPNVPRGVVTEYTWNSSKIFPGTTRKYWVYVPAQYKPEKPAAVMVFQDGAGYISETGATRGPLVLDNLIHAGAMPVTVGVFIDPGVLPALGPNQQARLNRSYEYDSLSDRYARFVLDEILPEVGKRIRLSSDPNDRAIAGQSSGGIAAFTAAWLRPDAFHRVLSFIGSYTDLRGGNTYSALVRKTEPKPLRVFLQDGSADQNIYAGNWWIANQDLASALKFAGYDVNFTTGIEGHNMKQGGPLLPDALHWLWRDYPAPIAKPVSANARHVIAEILDPSKGWELVSQGHRFTEGPAVNSKGEVFFTDIPNNRVHKIGLDGKVSVWRENTGGTNGLMFGPDGRLYGCQDGNKRVVSWGEDGSEKILAEGLGSNDVAVDAAGNVYFSDPGQKKVWLIAKDGTRRTVHEGLNFPNGVRLSPDHQLLYVADYLARAVWSFQVQPDGNLANGQPFYFLESADERWPPVLADGMTVDSENFLYVATSLGIQVCDQLGRVNAIINKPQPGTISNVVFGGPNLDTLYVTASDKVFKRQIRRKGVFPWQPSKPPAGRP